MDSALRWTPRVTDSEAVSKKLVSPPCPHTTSKVPDKSKSPPLRGLFDSGTKTLTKQLWEEVERPCPPTTSKVPDKSKLPPLRGLFVSGTKKLTKQLWEEVERNNLAYISETGNNEFYLCNTDANSIRKSFRDFHQLEISFRNMENIASLGRGRKLLVLRTQLNLTNKLFVVGIAMVNTSAGIEKDVKNDRYSVRVTYLCLSIPTFAGSTFAPSLSDGVELSTHISGSFIQQYMLNLRQRTIKPLFPTIYPWYSFLPSQNYTSTSQNKVSVDSTPLVAINSNIDRLQDSYGDDIFTEVRKGVEKRDMSFQQINSELAEFQQKGNVDIPPMSVSPSNGSSKEAVESQMHQYSKEFSEMIYSGVSSKSDSRSRVQRNGLFNIPGKTETGVKKIGRGRGRGMVLLQQASAAVGAELDRVNAMY